MHVSTWPGQASLPKPQSSQMGFNVGGVDRLGKARIAPVNHSPAKTRAGLCFCIQHQFSGSIDNLAHLHLVLVCCDNKCRCSRLSMLLL